MTTEHAIVYAKAFSSVPSMLKMSGNKSSSYVKLEQGVSKVSKNGIEVVAEDLTTVKVGSSNNKNTVTQIGKNSKEVVLYEDKNSKITVDVKDVFIEDTGTTKSTNINQQVNKGTTSNNQKGEGVSKISITKDKSGTNQLVDNTPINKMTVDDFSKLGKIDKELKGVHKGDARFIIGSKEDAIKMFEARVGDINSVTSKSEFFKDGTLKGYIKTGKDIYGNKIIFRDFSTKGGSFPTIDIYKTINGKEKKIMELKFKE